MSLERIVDHALIRTGAFWLVVAAILLVLTPVAPSSNWSRIIDVFGEVTYGEFKGLSDKAFVYALASLIGQFAGALSIALLVVHVLPLRLALRRARRHVTSVPDDPRAFAVAFDTISDRLINIGVIRDAWKAFRKTTFQIGGVIYSTERPQSFLNAGDAREQFFALKLMPSVPGYFVGLGLLLTFVGLVIALSAAVAATEAGSAENMGGALNGLLHAATFKFSTSIAGLGASLALSLIFRSYQITLDKSYYGVCRALETRMVAHPAERVAVESQEILAAQRDELKEINSDRFFTRLGETVSPGLQAAMGSALQPVAARLDAAIGHVTQTSQSGVEDMLARFTDSLRGGAGAELGQAVAGLDATRIALEGVRDGLSGSGKDFSQQMADAADRLSRMVGEAGERLGGSADSAAGSVEKAMTDVTVRLRAQMTGFAEGLSSLQSAFERQAEDSVLRNRQVADTAAAATDDAVRRLSAASARVVGEALEAMQNRMADATGKLEAGLAALSSTLRRVEASMAGHASQIDAAAVKSRETADAFGKVAADVRVASQPLAAHGERLSRATEAVASSVAQSVDALSTTEERAQTVADALAAHFGRIDTAWNAYRERFERVDEDFGNAAERFHKEVSRHQEAMQTFVVELDKHTATILERLSSAAAMTSENVEELSETLDDFLNRLRPS